MRHIKEIRFKLFISDQLQTFKEYAEFVESNLRKELNDYVDLCNHYNMDEDDFLYWHYDEISQYRDHFPSIMRNSLFISIYSFLEDKVIDLCKSTDETGKKLDELKGNGIQRASSFIKKVKKEYFPDDTKEWNFIQNANKIRNCIVHCGGDIEKAKEPEIVRNAVNGLKNVKVDIHNNILLNEDFCTEFIDVVDKFLSDLYRIDSEILKSPQLYMGSPKQSL
ncbi:hypothetical protein [Bacillus halotolerans]|uniref:hypothetical protein n=1 Tax=Bacillus halotolerans TaxID=260554 RepID=UPI00227DB27B|nr:hypothetical protein [Bacillus halotolerans]MCY8473303.1 hypothetical protein [Bacillus halotolerans]MED1936332.1 hypothetical protein [Bacillus subtilis]